MSRSHLQRNCLLLCCCLLITALQGCAPAQEAPSESAPAHTGIAEVGTPLELYLFLEGGGTQARLTADINLGAEMLSIPPADGMIIDGGGHTLKGLAPCVIRVEDGYGITLKNIVIDAAQTGIGYLGGGTLTAEDCTIRAHVHGVEAAGALAIAGSLTVEAETGMGIHAVGMELAAGGSLQSTGELAALSAGRGDIIIGEGASVTCASLGDNTVKTDGSLILHASCRFAAENTGEHNAARVGTLEAAETATLELTGGYNGIGLFIVRQQEDVTLNGFCTPELRIENGGGVITFPGDGDAAGGTDADGSEPDDSDEEDA